ncbi:hypothetical protein Nepgr_009610 [Nepenthes gracilis]|uniref:BHLH domain-containing protein n=1 Tax=Nepenthes gracilis TaxID=150966 RepID=A0AAD3XKI4_NEPGR|nr:hypothetical protein Nepgr_009610 [Nepenthes gracilis]
MALEAVVYNQDLLGNNSRGSPFNLQLEDWGSDLSFPKEGGGGGGGTNSSYQFLLNQAENCDYGNWDLSPPSMVPALKNHEWLSHVVPSGTPVGPNRPTNLPLDAQSACASAITLTRLKQRRRARIRKNRQEIENQRMTHIAVERKRRKQMNEYLSVLRSLVPDSYVQRGDQASIIGAAIDFVKELEQNLQCLSAQKHNLQGEQSPWPFEEFFTFPQYLSRDKLVAMKGRINGECCQSGVADIEVTMVERHANLKIRFKPRPKQLLKMVSGLQNLRLTILHLNVTNVNQVSLYSLSVKVEDDSKLSTVDEIAAAVYQMVCRIQEVN